MKICSDCYTNCPEIGSDRCIKYTGPDVPVLNIKTGDSVAYVVSAISQYVISVIEAHGIKVTLEPADICPLVSSYLPSCEDINALNLFEAVVKSICSLNSSLTSVQNFITNLESAYSIGSCLTVSPTAGTKAILQDVINTLCSTVSFVNALSVDLSTNYVRISDINTYIASYIAGTSGSKHYTKMVPYVIYPYFGPITDFDSTGKGLPTSSFEKVYICNGLNGTPDLRGRALVGAIAGVPGPALPPDVDPGASSFNPNYSLGSIAGQNYVTLTLSQIPSHSHSATVNENPHTHSTSTPFSLFGTGGGGTNSSGTDFVLQQSGNRSTTAINAATTGVTVTIGSSGGGQPHSNIQPVRAVHYIMYIP